MAAVKATTETVGIIQMAASWGAELTGTVFVDSSAALAVVGRKRNGKLRHVRAGLLWVQEGAERVEIAYRKILGHIKSR